MSVNISFTKENIDEYLKKLAKYFKKVNGKYNTAEIILIGGGSILLNYDFREATTDLDAYIYASSAIKDAINKVSDECGLPNNWLNDDFIYTKSFSKKIVQYSQYYKTFYNVLEVRTISKEYLIAMKLMSGREYKNDMSDVVGILKEQYILGNPISFDDVDKAVKNLYGGWEAMPVDSKKYISETIQNGNFEDMYIDYIEKEQANREILSNFQKQNPNQLNDGNVNDVLNSLKNYTTYTYIRLSEPELKHLQESGITFEAGYVEEKGYYAVKLLKSDKEQVDKLLAQLKSNNQNPKL